MTLQNVDIKEWYLEINTIDKHLEQSASNILGNCEKLSSILPPTPQAQAIIASISESCNFHDINSQRLRKILKAMQQIMQGKHADVNNGVASGPQRPGEALTQSDVEDILRNSL